MGVGTTPQAISPPSLIRRPSQDVLSTDVMSISRELCYIHVAKFGWDLQYNGACT